MDTRCTKTWAPEDWGEVDPIHFQRVDELFEAALERSRTNQRRFLEQHCDSALRHDVELLLQADVERQGFLDDPLVDLATPVSRSGPAGRPTRIGPYKILRELGRGGMGLVFLAVRDDDQYHQSVAIKVLKREAHRAEAAYRFRVERQILANLEHPNIARLYDGGTTAQGLLYLVMEYVDGLPIDLYCDHNRLTIDQRLELFQQICQAVHHAHQNLLVHRDLKPDNVLVTASGVVKLLDFGIAKLLDPRQHPETVRATRPGLRMMTPGFASPEQIRGEAVTTATDVYGLGVMLFQLLAGVSPYRPLTDQPGELERMICEQQPEKPSTAVERLGGPAEEASRRGSPTTMAQVSRARREQRRDLRRRLRGDLDNIVLMALRKEPERRYGSAGQFADDVRRHLNAHPVVARRDTPAYRLRKFIRRNCWLALTASLALALLVALLATSAWQSLRLARQNVLAEVQRDKAEQALDFLVDVFAASDVVRTGQRPATAHELLDAGAREVHVKISDPDVRATLMASIGEVYLGLGRYEEAEALLSEAYNLRRGSLGEEHPEMAASLLLVARLHRAKGELEEAELSYRQVLALQDKLNVDEVEKTPALTGLGDVLQERGEYDQAESLLRQVLSIHHQNFGAKSIAVAESLWRLGLFMTNAGHRYAEAEELLRDALAIQREVLDSKHPKIAITLDGLATALRSLGELNEAETLLVEAVAIFSSVVDENHPLRVASMNNLALVRFDLGDLAGAGHLHRELLLLKQKAFGDKHPRTVVSKQNLAMALQEQDRLGEAEELFREVLNNRREIFGETHPKVGLSLYCLGEAVLRRGRVDDAERYFRQSLDMLRQTLPKDHLLISSALFGLGKIAITRGDPALALTFLEHALEIRRALKPGHWRIAKVQGELGVALAALGRHDEATALFQTSYDAIRTQLGEQHRMTTTARQRLVRK